MKNLLLLISLIIVQTSYSQEEEPPQLAMPTEENKVLIDVFVETSMLKTYFINHASAKIDYAGYINKWSWAEMSSRKEKISFEKFKAETYIYNAMASFTKKELEALIDFSRTMNGGLKEPRILISVPMLEQNLDIFIEEEYLR